LKDWPYRKPKQVLLVVQYFTLRKNGSFQNTFIEVIENLSLDINYRPIGYICRK